MKTEAWMNYVLAILLSGVLLWLCSATKVEAPRVEYYRPAPPAKPTGYPMPCGSRDRVCKEIEKLKKAHV